MWWVGVACLLASAGLLALRYRLLAHRAHYNRLVQVFAILAVFWWLVIPWDLLFTTWLVFDTSLGKLGGLHWVIMVVVALRGHGSGMVARAQLIDTETLYRWLPKGTLSTRQRELFSQVQTRAGRDHPSPSPAPICYTLFAHDKMLFRKLRRAMDQAGHTYFDAGADYNILVIDGQTTPETVERMISSTTPFIPILAGNVDVLKKFPALGAYQLIDYRRREPQMLTILAHYIGNSEGHAALLGMSITPEQFGKTVFPAPATILATLVGEEHVRALVVLGLLSILLAYLLLVAL
jgi:hypothetical protein